MIPLDPGANHALALQGCADGTANKAGREDDAMNPLRELRNSTVLGFTPQFRYESYPPAPAV